MHRPRIIWRGGYLQKECDTALFGCSWMLTVYKSVSMN